MGVVKASDGGAAMDVLRKNNLDVFYLEPMASTSLSAKFAAILSRISQKDLVIFSRQLSVLISSNLPIIRALRIIGDQTTNRSLADICRSIAMDVEGGSSFSAALEKFPRQFDRLYSSVVRAGETSGNLQQSLDYLADHLEKAYELQRKIKGALMYPGFVLLAFVAIFFFLSVKVLPQLTDIIKESGVALPWTTKVVIVISDFMEKNWWIVLIMIVFGVGGTIYYFRTDEGRKNFDTMILSFPVIGVLIRYAYIARFAENLKMLLKQGVSIIDSFKIMADVMDNEIYRRIILKMMQSVERGKSMTESMYEDERAFPRMIPQMIKIGEEAGRTVEILDNIDNFYTREVDNMASNMTSLIEPLLIMVLGVGAGILVAAIIMPIYDMASSM